MEGLQPTIDIGGNNGMGNWGGALIGGAIGGAVGSVPGVVVAIGTMATAAVVVAAAPTATSM